MIIGIDASRANKITKTGVEWYSYHLIQALKEVIPSAVQVRLYTREPLRGELADLPESWEERLLTWPPRYAWTIARLSCEMLVRPPDVLFVPAHVLPPILPKRSVVTIHDIGFDRFPQLYPWRQRFFHHYHAKRALRQATRVLTISNWTRQEIRDLYGSNTVPVDVVPPAIDQQKYHTRFTQETIDDVVRSHSITAPYFIYVGRIEWKKNVARMVESFAQFQEQHDVACQFVLAGVEGYGVTEVHEVIKKHKLEEKVKLLRYVSEHDLPKLVAGAVALVFTTLYEGFGLPIIESMSVGTPVITSAVGAQSETAGKAALLVDPKDTATIAHAMYEVITNEVTNRHLREAGLLDAQKYSWQRTASEVWETLQKSI